MNFQDSCKKKKNERVSEKRDLSVTGVLLGFQTLKTNSLYWPSALRVLANTSACHLSVPSSFYVTFSVRFASCFVPFLCYTLCFYFVPFYFSLIFSRLFFSISFQSFTRVRNWESGDDTGTRNAITQLLLSKLHFRVEAVFMRFKKLNSPANWIMMAWQPYP
jgi:hypothetical protein